MGTDQTSHEDLVAKFSKTPLDGQRSYADVTSPTGYRPKTVAGDSRPPVGSVASFETIHSNDSMRSTSVSPIGPYDKVDYRKQSPMDMRLDKYKTNYDVLKRRQRTGGGYRLPTNSRRPPISPYDADADGDDLSSPSRNRIDVTALSVASFEEIIKVQKKLKKVIDASPEIRAHLKRIKNSQAEVDGKQLGLYEAVDRLLVERGSLAIERQKDIDRNEQLNHTIVDLSKENNELRKKLEEAQRSMSESQSIADAAVDKMKNWEVLLSIYSGYYTSKGFKVPKALGLSRWIPGHISSTTMVTKRDEDYVDSRGDANSADVETFYREIMRLTKRVDGTCDTMDVKANESTRITTMENQIVRAYTGQKVSEEKAFLTDQQRFTLRDVVKRFASDGGDKISVSSMMPFFVELGCKQMGSDDISNIAEDVDEQGRGFLDVEMVLDHPLFIERVNELGSVEGMTSEQYLMVREALMQFRDNPYNASAIKSNCLAEVLDMLGYDECPEDDLMKIRKRLDPNDTGEMNIDQILSSLGEIYGEATTDNNVISNKERFDIITMVNLYDSMGTGEIDASDLGDLLLDLGFEYSDEEIEKIGHQLGVNTSGFVPKSAVVQFVEDLSQRAAEMFKEEEVDTDDDDFAKEDAIAEADEIIESADRKTLNATSVQTLLQTAGVQFTKKERPMLLDMIKEMKGPDATMSDVLGMDVQTLFYLKRSMAASRKRQKQEIEEAAEEAAATGQPIKKGVKGRAGVGRGRGPLQKGRGAAAAAAKGGEGNEGGAPKRMVRGMNKGNDLSSKQTMSIKDVKRGGKAGLRGKGPAAKVGQKLGAARKDAGSVAVKKRGAAKRRDEFSSSESSDSDGDGGADDKEGEVGESGEKKTKKSRRKPKKAKDKPKRTALKRFKGDVEAATDHVMLDLHEILTELADDPQSVNIMRSELMQVMDLMEEMGDPEDDQVEEDENEEVIEEEVMVEKEVWLLEGTMKTTVMVPQKTIRVNRSKTRNTVKTIKKIVKEVPERVEKAKPKVFSIMCQTDEVVVRDKDDDIVPLTEEEEFRARRRLEKIAMGEGGDSDSDEEQKGNVVKKEKISVKENNARKLPPTVFKVLDPKTVGKYKGRIRDRRWINKQIATMYHEKYQADLTAVELGQPKQTLWEFVYDIHMQKYGLRNMAEQQIIDLFESFERIKPNDARATIFKKFCFQQFDDEIFHIFIHGLSDNMARQNNQVVMEETEGQLVMSVHCRNATLVALTRPDIEYLKPIMMNKIDALVANENKGSLCDFDKWCAAFVYTLHDHYLRQAEYAKEVFAEGDVDGNGVLDFDEWVTIMTNIEPNINLKEATAMYREALSYEKTNDGGISIPIFLKVLRLHQLPKRNLGFADDGGDD